jgi:transcription elongation factor GreA
MHDELTHGDLRKMQEEIDYRVQVLRPKLIEEVQTARAFGDLSENFEYKCAKQDKNRNDARIRYLQRMIKTAQVIEDRSSADTAGLYDTVEIFMENLGKSRRIQLVTTLRQDALKGLISKESPVGRAVMGAKVGDRVYVDMGGGRGYYVRIDAIEKGKDDGSIPIGSF